MIVVDACILVYLFNESEFTSDAQKVLEKDPHWIVPPIWQDEYGNVLSKLAKIEKRPIKQVISHFKEILSSIKHAERVPDNLVTLEISIKHKISFYDAHYVSLAVKNDTLLVTEDRDVIKRCPEYSITMQDFLTL